MITTRSPRPTPDCTAATSPAHDAAAAGSLNTPHPRATAGMAARISSSLTVTNPAPVSRTAAIAFTRSRKAGGDAVGHGVGRDRRLGHDVLPKRQASARKALPSAWTPTSRGIRSIQPMAKRSRSPLCNPPMMQPSPTPTVITSGACQPSASQIVDHGLLPLGHVGLKPVLRCTSRAAPPPPWRGGRPGVAALHQYHCRPEGVQLSKLRRRSRGGHEDHGPHRGCRTSRRGRRRRSRCWRW